MKICRICNDGKEENLFVKNNGNLCKACDSKRPRNKLKQRRTAMIRGLTNNHKNIQTNLIKWGNNKDRSFMLNHGYRSTDQDYTAKRNNTKVVRPKSLN